MEREKVSLFIEHGHAQSGALGHDMYLRLQQTVKKEHKLLNNCRIEVAQEFMDVNLRSSVLTSL